MHNKKLTPEQENDIVNQYLYQNISCPKLAQKYNVHYSTIYRIVKNHNILIKRHKLSRQYFFNEEFFNEINTESKAYFLGFAYADGYNNGYGLRINLKESDIEILEKFQKEIKSNYPIYRYVHKDHPTWENMVSLSLNSKFLSLQLDALGCTNNKSLTLQWNIEDLIPANLIHHFIRGYFDGDGSLGIKEGGNSNSKFNCNICSSIFFLTGFKKYLKECLDIHLCICKDKMTHANFARGYISGNIQIKTFVKWMYKEADIFLERKHKIASYIINY